MNYKETSKFFTKSFLVIFFVTMFVLSGVAVKAFTDNTLTPPNCSSTLEGCNPPVNTGATTQIKNGSFGVTNALSIMAGKLFYTAPNLLHGSGPVWAGTIGYKTNYNLDWNGIFPYVQSTTPTSREALVIIGGGQIQGDRFIKFWDNVDVVGNLTSNNATSTNLSATNRVYTNVICTLTGICFNVNELGTGGSSKWTDTSPVGNIYRNSAVGIQNTGPTQLLEVGNSTRTGPSYVKVHSSNDRFLGFLWASGGSDKWSLYKAPNSNDLRLNEISANTDRVTFKAGGGLQLNGVGASTENTTNTRIVTMDTTGNLSWRNPGSWTGTTGGTSLPSGSANQTLRHDGNGWVGNSSLVISSTGNIGIGASSPAEKLAVVSADNTSSTNIFAVRANNLSQGIGLGWNAIRSIGTNANNNLSVDAKGTGNLLLQTNATGNVGIGITNPAAKLDVNGIAATKGLLVTGNLQLVNGNQGAGKVLMSDAGGVASWVATSTLGISGGTTGVTQITAGDGITISPTTGTGNVTISTSGSSGHVSGGHYGFLATAYSLDQSLNQITTNLSYCPTSILMKAPFKCINGAYPTIQIKRYVCESGYTIIEVGQVGTNKTYTCLKD